MKKVIGRYYHKPLELDKGQEFEITITAEDLYHDKDMISKSNQLILDEISKQYHKSRNDLHNFFVITTIADQ